jgi:2,4-dienoyl-CoA reductase-like NADH-dependent reductase (Old Yellow Enzyme family)/thioredoxin reductase
MKNYPNLFSPITVNGVQLKNRLVMAPMATRYANYGGYVTERLVRYYQERAAGGVGLITVEATAISSEGIGWPNNLAVYNDTYIDGLKLLADAIHHSGAKASLEIFHTGRRALSAVIFQQPVAPSAIPPAKGETPRELTVIEIEKLTDQFIQGAVRAEKAGFDFVNLHMAHGYLIQQFLSPLSNHRDDRYGGDTLRRCQFAVDIIKGVRHELGPKYPIICRLTVDEGINAGLNLTEGQKIAPLLVEAGADWIDVSAGGPEAPQLTVQPMSMSRGCLVHLAAGIKKVVDKPVSIVGRINTPDLAEEILAKGQADLIVIGRPLLADPEFPQKAQEGRSNEIRTCIACNHGCSGRLSSNMEISCLVNPRVGREADLSTEKAETSKRVLVVGGGPAGMEAAATAAERGHLVRLVEKKSSLGGQEVLAGTLPHKEEFLTHVRYQTERLKRLGVEVMLNSSFSPENVDDFKPEVIIEATGAEPVVPKIEGLETANVYLAWDVLEQGIQENWKKVAIIGGGEVGCETAEYLGAKGVEAIIVEALPTVAGKMNSRDREQLLSRLKALPVDIITDALITSVCKDSLSLNRGGLELVISSLDAVIIAGGSKMVNIVFEDRPGVIHYQAGDCIAPKRMFDAVHQGFAAGLNV